MRDCKLVGEQMNRELDGWIRVWSTSSPHPPPPQSLASIPGQSWPAQSVFVGAARSPADNREQRRPQSRKKSLADICTLQRVSISSED